MSSSTSLNANGVFTLPDTEIDKKWVVYNCVEVFTLPDTDTVTDADTDADAIGLRTHFVSVGVCVGVGVRQCEHTITTFHTQYAHVFTDRLSFPDMFSVIHKHPKLCAISC